MGLALSGLSAACCLGSCACSAMKCCCSSATGKDGLSGSCAKVCHVVLLGLSTILALILRYKGDEMDINLYAWSFNCDDGNTTHTETGIHDYYAYCKGDAAVFRISFVLTVFFFCTLLGSLCSPGFHRGWWGPKLAAFFILLIGSIWIPNYVFDNSGYAWVARVASTLFLLLQILILIDFGYQWNNSWVERAYEGASNEYSDATNPKWLYAVLTSAAALYVLTIVGVVLLYIYYAGCSTGRATTTLSLLSVLGITALSLFRDKIVGEEGAILPAAVVSLYIVYLNWSALDSNPDADCKPSQSRDTATITIGIIVAAVSLMWSSMSASRNAGGLLKGQNADEVAETESGSLDKPFYRVDEGDEKDPESGERDPTTTSCSANGVPSEGDSAKQDAEDARESYWFFHLIMMAASMYMAMLLTNWGAQESDDVEYSSNYGNASMWVKIISEWLTVILFVWTLVAPKVLAGRDFN